MIHGLLKAGLALAIAMGAATAPQAAGPHSDADIVIIGEVHDNPAHHRRQAELIHDIRPSAVAFEMLTPQQADIANNHPQRDQGLGDALNWEDSGWPDFSLYLPVFEALGSTPIYGMALPRAKVSRAVSEGAAAVFGKDAGKFGLDRPLPEREQRRREQHQQTVHCNMLPPDLLAGMVEAQRLRDASFASVALRALQVHGRPVVVIAGTGHARRDWGIPHALAVAAPEVKVASIGQLEEEPEDSNRFDRWFVSEPVERGDPCEAFAAPKAP